MATRRMINKDDFESLEFHALTIRQKFLFWATNLYADDDGVIPFMIAKSKIYPMEDISLDELLEDYKQLEQYDFVMLYSNDDYIQVCDWWNRQFIDNKIYKPTQVRTLPPSYRPRPKDLKKYHFASRVVLEQSNEEESSVDESILEEISEGENERRHSEYPLDN